MTRASDDTHAQQWHRVVARESRRADGAGSTSEMVQVFHPLVLARSASHVNHDRESRSKNEGRGLRLRRSISKYLPQHQSN
eukprot:scaffold284180_cov32-Tisochrysis_lutea.AAC.5